MKEDNNENSTKIAILSDLLIGTRFYNPDIMTGVGKVLSQYSDLKRVVIDGGLIARVPKYFGKQNAQFFSILDSDIQSKYGKEVAEKVREIHEFKISKALEESEAEGLVEGTKLKIPEKKRVGIDSLEEIIEIAQPELAKINLPADADFYYVWGEEDYDNVKDMIETKIHELIALKEQKKKGLEQELDRAEETREVKYKEIKKAEEEISLIGGEIKKQGTNISERLQKKLERSEEQRKKLVGQLEHLNVAFKSYERHLATLEAEKSAISKRIRSFTKTWQLSRDEYDNMEKTGVLNRALKDYKEILYPMFKGKHLIVDYHLEEMFSFDNVLVNISHNRNAIASNAILGSAIKKRVSGAKIKNIRGERVADFDLEGHHAGGFKVYPQKKGDGTDNPIYFIQVPPLEDALELRKARNEWIKTWDTKRFDYPFASGLVLTNVKKDGVVEIEFYSSELLKKLAKDKPVRGKELKIEVISDIHIGAPNEPGFMTNYEMIEAIKKYQGKKLPDIVVVGGDAINGQHLEQIIFQYLRENPARLDAEKKRISSLSLKEEARKKMLKNLENKIEAAQTIMNISEQKDTLKLMLYEPYWKKILEKGGDLILVSGQHFNKSVHFREDEAKEIANLIDEKYRSQVHIFDGAEYGSGLANVKGLDIYAIHSPVRGQDEVSGLINHMSRINKKVDLAVGGDYHHPGVGYADGTAFVAAAGLQTWNKYVDQIGKQGGVRGIVNVYLNPKMKGYVRYELVFDSALKNVLEENK